MGAIYQDNAILTDYETMTMIENLPDLTNEDWEQDLRAEEGEYILSIINSLGE